MAVVIVGLVRIGLCGLVQGEVLGARRRQLGGPDLLRTIDDRQKRATWAREEMVVVRDEGGRWLAGAQH